MTTTWPTPNADDQLSGKDGLASTPEMLWDMMLCALQSGTGVAPSGGTALAAWDPLDTFEWAAPLFARAGMFVRVYVYATPSGGNGDLRLAQSATKGGTVAVTAAGFYEVTLALEAGWIDARQTYTIEGQTAGTTIAISSDGILMPLRVSD